MREEWGAWVVVLLASLTALGIEATSSAKPSDELTFTGKVLNAAGEPIPDVEVLQYEVAYGGSRFSYEAKLVAQQRTGADGSFTLTTIKDPDVHRNGAIVVRKEGLAVGWAAWRVREDEQTDITLGTPTPLTGIVVDEADAPVSDAEVGIVLAIIGKEEDRRYLDMYTAGKVFHVTTDSDGKFVFPDMPAEATFEFLVTNPGKATLCSFDVSSYRGEKLQYAPGQSDIKFALSPEAQIEGVVIEKASEEPVADVQVIAQPVERTIPLPPESMASTEDGHFRLTGLPAGNYRVQLLPPAERMADWVAVPVGLSLKAGETKSDVTLALTKGAIIEVVVKDGANNKPIEKASISIRDVQNDQWSSARTDANGTASIRVAPGRYAAAQAYKEGYTRQNQQRELSLEEGQTERVEWTLVAAPKVAGVVRDPNGDPAADVTLDVKPHGGGGQLTTNAEGRFEMTWDPRAWGPEDVPYVLVARSMERNLAAAIDIDEDMNDLEIKLEPGVVFSGIVFNHKDEPLSEARVSVWIRVSNYSTTLGREEIRTDENGRFEAKAIPPGRNYSVRATAEGFGMQTIQAAAPDAEDSRMEVGTFKLPEANLSVSGVVVDVNDEPVPNVRIYFYGDRQPEYHDIRTDENGKFTIEKVCQGRMNINANVSGTRQMYGNVQTEGGATDVKVVVAERGTSGRRFVPRKPKPLVGKPLPDLKDCGVELVPADTEGKMLLVCFWDMNQRPSRHCVTQLAKAHAELREKGITVVAVQAANADEEALKQWVEKYKIPFPVGLITGDIEKRRFAWGATSLPHLVLTDKNHKVTAEGFNLRELDEQINSASSQ